MEWRRDSNMEKEYIELKSKVHTKSFIVLIYKALYSLRRSYARTCDKQIARRTAYNFLKLVFSKKSKWKYSMFDVDMIMMFARFDEKKKAKQVGYESSLMIIDEDAHANGGLMI